MPSRRAVERHLYPKPAGPRELFAHFDKWVPNDIVNDRWRTLAPGAIRHNFGSEAYRSSPEISKWTFETIRGIGCSFAFNRNGDANDRLSSVAPTSLFVDIVSKNGNLVLNVDQPPDGTIPRGNRRMLLLSQGLTGGPSSVRALEFSNYTWERRTPLRRPEAIRSQRQTPRPDLASGALATRSIDSAVYREPARLMAEKSLDRK